MGCERVRWSYGDGGHAAVHVLVLRRGAQGWFDTYLLLANPGEVASDLMLTFLREGDVPVTKAVAVGAHARVTVSAATVPELATRAFGIVVTATQPIVAERAMYFGTTADRLWSGGHASAGATEPAQRWFYAEGATGSFFDTFILLGNPQSVDAHVTHGAGRAAVERTRQQPRPRAHRVAQGRRGRLRRRSRQGAHVSAAVESLGDGGGGDVTYVREHGAAPIVKTYTVAPTTRSTIDVSAVVPELQHEAFGPSVEVTSGVTISVEQSRYWNTTDVFWAAGTNAAGTRLP